MSFSVAGPAGTLRHGKEPAGRPMRIGAFRVEPDLNRITGPSGEVLLEPKTMAVLVYLAGRAGQVVGNNELVDSIWLGRPMGDNPVYRCISQLRRAFGDNARHPAYIATVPTRGYRLLAPVFSLVDGSAHAPAAALPACPSQELAQETGRKRGRWPAVALAVVVAGVAAGLWMAPPQRTAAAPASGPPTVAVLPFKLAADDPEIEALADAIAAALLGQLAAYGELRVVARSSSFALRGSGFEVERTARLLGVQYLLQGELQPRGERLAIHLELVNRDGFQVWSRSFEHTIGDGFALQAELASAMAERMAGRVLALPGQKREPDFAAYQHWVMGHELMIRRPQGFDDAARAHFDQAIELDPAFAEPYAERAIHLLLMSGAAEDDSVFASATQDIDRAFALDPNSALAHAALGFLKWTRQLADDPLADDVAAEAEFRRALELDPQLVSVWNWLARALMAQGRHDEADVALATAARADPLAATIGANLARSEAARGQFKEAEARLLRLSEIPQPPPVAPEALAELYVSTGRFLPALETLRQNTVLSVSEHARNGRVWQLTWVAAALGDFESIGLWRSWLEAKATDPIRLRLEWWAESVLLPHPSFAESAHEFRLALGETGLELHELSARLRLQYGSMLALSGELQAGRDILEPLLEPGGIFQWDDLVLYFDARHALCWAWLHTGARERAVSQLRLFESYFERQLTGGRLHRSEDLVEYARNQLLLGKREHALDLLERAEQSGWRGYHYLLKDPRWAALRGNSRFEAVMARVKADIDAQRAEIEAAMPQKEFIARLDAATESRDEMMAAKAAILPVSSKK